MIFLYIKNNYYNKYNGGVDSSATETELDIRS